MDNFLSIFEKKEEVKIDEEKLPFMASKVDIWDFFGISQSQYLSLSTEEKSKILREYYKKLLIVYFCDGKKSIFCCGNCVWFDDGKKQDCVNCRLMWWSVCVLEPLQLQKSLLSYRC